MVFAIVNMQVPRHGVTTRGQGHVVFVVGIRIDLRFGMYKCIEQGELTMTGIYDVHLSGRIADVNPFAEIIIAFQETSCLFFNSYTFLYIFIADIVQELLGDND